MTNSRNKILQACMEQFIKPAGQSYTVDALASDLGCSKKTIYKYFKSKNELLDAVFSNYKDIVLRRFQSINNGSDGEVDILMKYIYAVDRSVWEIRMSRWYIQSKDSSSMQEQYFDLRLSVFENYMLKALIPFEQNLLHRGKTNIHIADYIIGSLESHYLNTPADQLKNTQSKTFVDTLLFLVHGYLIHLEDD